MAATKKASGLAKKPAGSVTASKPTGQTFAERQELGRHKIEFWADETIKGKLEKLVTLTGAKYPKDVLIQAVNDLAAKYGL